MRPGPCLTAFAIGFLLLATPSFADESTEDRLRDALRQAVSQMRAAQDQAAQAQADVQRAQQDRTALQSQLDGANAKIAEGAAKPVARPEDLSGLKAEIAQGRAQNAALQQGLQKYQSAYQGVAGQAHALAQEAQAAQTGLKASTMALQTCKGTNTKLIGVSEDILHLYESQDFRGLLLRSYEPLIGSAKVKLENLVQDYDDKIREQEYVPPRSPHS